MNRERKAPESIIETRSEPAHREVPACNLLAPPFFGRSRPYLRALRLRTRQPKSAAYAASAAIKTIRSVIRALVGPASRTSVSARSTRT